MSYAAVNTIREVSITAFRKRQVGVFDLLDLDGDFKILFPTQKASIPSAHSFRHENVVMRRDVEGAFEYAFPEVGITRLSDALVSRTGAVLIGGSAIEETLEGSLHENFDLENISNPVPQAEVVASSRYGNFNHAIFLCETSPLIYLSMVDQQTRFLPKILYFNRRYCNEQFELEHLSLIGNVSGQEKLPLAWLDQPVAANTVYIPSVSRRRDAFRASLMTRFLAEKFISENPVQTGDRELRSSDIYISRRHANSRVPDNIDELELLARSAGFTPVYLELLSCSEQISLLQVSRNILSEHGAGLINLMFCRGGTKVFELFPSAMYAKWTFRLVAYAAGLTYACGSFPVADGWVYNKDPVYIEPSYFVKCLNLLTHEI